MAWLPGDKRFPSMSQIVRATSRHGEFFCVALDEFITLSLLAYGEFSQSEWDLFAQVVRPGMAVVEVGANIGAHTVPLARLCAPGPLLAFEPQQRVYQLLCANLAVNGVENVLAYPDACGAVEDTAAIRRLDFAEHRNVGAASVQALDGADIHRSHHTVRILPLDSFNLPACDFIKVDVEGMEVSVIEGAAETIRRCRPILYVENDRPIHQLALIATIDALGYRQYWHKAAMHNPNNFRGTTADLFGDLISLNMLCVPKETDLKVTDLEEVDAADPRAPAGIRYPG